MQTIRPSAAHLADLEPYDPKYLSARIYLNANENPYGMPEMVKRSLEQAIAHEQLHRYPDPLAKRLRNALAAKLGVASDCVLLGNGGDELLFDICLAYGGEGRKMLIAPPTFSVYYTNAILTHTELVEVSRASGISPEKLLDFSIDEEAILARASSGDVDIIMLTSPNNPTGDCLSLGFIEKLLEATDALVLIDHAYIEFAQPEYDATSLLSKHANLVILRTFSKAYGLAGLRIGYVTARNQVIKELCKVRQPYSVDTLAALAALTALEEEDEVQEKLAVITAERERMAQEMGLSGLGLPLAPSQANYLLVRVPNAHEVWQQLYDTYSILVRDVSLMPSLTDCLRVSIGTIEENTEFLQALRTILGKENA